MDYEVTVFFAYHLDHLEDFPFVIGVMGVSAWGRVFKCFNMFALCFAYEFYLCVEVGGSVVEFEECACCYDHFTFFQWFGVGGVDGDYCFHHLPPSTVASALLFVLKPVTLSSVFEDFPFLARNSCTHAIALWALSCSCGA